LAFHTAQTVVDWMYRATNYFFQVQVLDEQKEPETLTGSETVKFYLYRDYTQHDAEPCLELTGVVVDAPNGIVGVVIEPQHTEDLVARAYDMTVTVDGDVALQGRFGISHRG